MSHRSARLAFGAAAAAMLILSGCTKTDTVYVETPPWENPSDTAGEFMGYNNSASKTTVCGNCHVGQSSRWAETAHATAWQGLQDSGHAQAFCENCHATGPNGNFVPVEWVKANYDAIRLAVQVGIIVVEEHPGKNRGELRFSNPQKDGDEELAFDVLGQIIEVYSGGEVILDAIFPDA